MANTDESTTPSGVKTITKYGQHPLYFTWKNMMRRCYDQREVTYYMYGAVGVTVCDRWHVFKNFLEDMQPKPSTKHTLDRIRGEIGYSKDNCRWATIFEQNANKRTNVWLEFRGQRKIVAEWARVTGFSESLIKTRLKRGWPVERILTHDPKIYHHRISAEDQTASMAFPKETPGACPC